VLGHSHALSGLAVGAATLPWAPVEGTVSQVAWIAAVGGFAMLPDLDQHCSTVSDMWGPVTDVPSNMIGGPGWARAQLSCHLGALALMVPALGFAWPRVFAAGGLLMALAIGLFAWTVWPTLRTIRAQVAARATIAPAAITIQPPGAQRPQR